ncbi:MAG: hypothetical protein COT81_02105 [Candidatus Buchananbacteria bacterium CG10_big_fil_rev_8_21_14_0_10_42_9]|uniref:Uncharacterized protein n=1 Tax=Candidatus Buchananbacteria bacterium CG10_big_fil_rev_8_21_14_0_10_42_9 TaxID=1974526 RepID=A0A2H0W1J8_9BACT|nr:MAG: hypothetical protein COT81_02105 [Candidatus Buchananbacteria bacterium CG10_big_fil_rev_8_21_14_0_10_42_9]
MSKTKFYTKRDRFKNLAEKRTNEVLYKLKVLSNCANRQLYEYTDDEIKSIFKAIEAYLEEVKDKFNSPKEKVFKLK